MTQAREVTATFNTSTTYTLSVSRNGAGSGSVASNLAGISCGSTCSASYSSGTNVILTASAASDSTFAGWSGACTNSTGTCTVTMSAAKSVTATFDTAASGIDLTIEDEITPTSVPLTGIVFKTNIINQGTASTGAGFPYFFQKATGVNSANEGIDVSNLNSPTVFKETGALDGGGESREVDSPSASLSVGIHYIRACADKEGQDTAGPIVESDEENNCGPWTRVAVGPDLTASVPVLDAEDSPAQFDIPLTFSSTVINNGKGNVSGLVHHIFQYDNDANHSDASFVEVPTTANINENGGSIPISAEITLPTNASGMYYMRVCADKVSQNDDGSVEESDEENNCSDAKLQDVEDGWSIVYVGGACAPGPCEAVVPNCLGERTSMCSGLGTCPTPEPSGPCPTTDSCSKIHFGCLSGYQPVINTETTGTTKWTWYCEHPTTGVRSAQCSELKKKPIIIED
jgi:hypothetical protein